MKCKYCGEECAESFCSFKCRKAYLDIFDEIDKWGESRKSYFILAILISIPVIVLFGGPGVTVMCALIGLIVIRHPYPSKRMKKKMSVKDAVTHKKILGALIILIGIPFIPFYWLPFFL